MKKTVYVERSEYEYERMFQDNGWKVVTFEEADFIQFTGGEDVDPSLYKEERHFSTRSNLARDKKCMAMFEEAQVKGKACLGICRGSQFLTVACGGSLWQDVENHAVRGTHAVVDLRGPKIVPCSSTHHQMMDSRSIFDREILAISGAHVDTRKYRGNGVPHFTDYDEEANWYPRHRSMVFQPHPEFFTKDHPCQKFYFELIERCFG